MGQSGGQLSEESGAFRLMDRPVHLTQLTAHSVNRTREIRDLVICLADLESLEVPSRDPRHLLIKALQPATDPMGNPPGYHNHG